MIRTQLPPNKTASFVLPRWKTVYISVPKAGCTSLKWLLADLQDESPQRFYEALSMETSRSMLIHHRYLWQNTPMLRRLSDEQLAEMGPDQGWFVFAAVRHPSARLWSGWQSKWLLREPRFRELFPDHDLWPRVPTKSVEIVEDFDAFVQRLRDVPDDPTFADRHFRSQHELLRDDVFPYTRIYRTSEMGQLVGDLERHLRNQGFDRPMPRLRRFNETPLVPLRSVFSDRNLETIGRRYAGDFTRYGFDELLPANTDPSSEYGDAAVAEIGHLVERSERIHDLYRIGLEARQEATSARDKLARARARIRQQQDRQAALDATPLRRARRRLGRIRRALKARVPR